VVFVCFSTAYYDAKLWTNRQHVMTCFSESHRVLYVESRAGLSVAEAVFNVLRGRFRVGRLFRWSEKKHDRLIVCCPLVLPGEERSSLIERINTAFVAWYVRRLLGRLGWGRPILWTYHPEAVRLAGRLHEKLLCYDCVDDIASFPKYSLSRRRERIERLERELIEKADLFFVTTESLKGKKAVHPERVHVVPNVADFEHFSRAALDSTPVAPEVERIRRPILGFVGALSGYKVDLDLLAYVARKRPEWSLVLIGPAGIGERKTHLADLKRMPNVFLLGERPYGDLPFYLKGFDVCMIPFRRNEYTAHVFPIKFFEFLATGKPVVITPIPSLCDYYEYVRVGENPDRFIEQLQAAIAEDPDEKRAARVALARRNSWEKRVSALLALVSRTMEERGLDR